MFESSIYHGMEETLKSSKAKNKYVILLTSNLRNFGENILKYYLVYIIISMIFAEVI